MHTFIAQKRTGFFLLSAISLMTVSCGQSESPVTTDTPPSQDWIPVDTLPPLGSVYSNTYLQIELTDISGRSFSFGPDIDTAKFEATGECDCCMDDLLFIDDSSFVRIYYCVEDQSICSGTYTVSAGGIHLVYDSTVVKRVYDQEMYEAGISTGESPYTNEINYMNEPFAETLTAWQYKDGFFLKNDGKNIYYGIENLESSMKHEIEFLRMDGVWDLLEMHYE